MRRPRFRTRTLMVAVAVAALAIGGELMRRRASAYRTLASSHREDERMHRESVDLATAEADDLLQRGSRDGADLWSERACFNAHQAAYHAALARKYERAARFPWLPIAPDPPAPE